MSKIYHKQSSVIFSYRDLFKESVSFIGRSIEFGPIMTTGQCTCPRLCLFVWHKLAKLKNPLKALSDQNKRYKATLYVLPDAFVCWHWPVVTMMMACIESLIANYQPILYHTKDRRFVYCSPVYIFHNQYKQNC